jgi:hypothetical protein
MAYANLTDQDILDLQRLLNHRGWRFVERDSLDRIQLLEQRIFHGELSEVEYKAAVAEHKGLARFLQDLYAAAELPPPERISRHA